MNDELYLVGRADAGIETWRFDTGTSSWSLLAVASPPWSDNPNGWNDETNYSTIQTAVVNDELYLVGRADAGIETWKFSAGSNSGRELWKSDGTEAGTVRVKDINPGSASSDPRDLTNVNGTLFFSAYDGSSGRELWRSDGTEAGTVRVRDIFTGSDSSAPYDLTNVNGTLFFSAADDSSGAELWALASEVVTHLPIVLKSR